MLSGMQLTTLTATHGPLKFAFFAKSYVSHRIWLIISKQLLLVRRLFFQDLYQCKGRVVCLEKVGKDARQLSKTVLVQKLC
jgi:hypothetical protein